jgi:hypothetical protein
MRSGWPEFDEQGRLYAWVLDTSYGVFHGSCAAHDPALTRPPVSRAERLALEVRNGVRWPWLDPRAVVRALRGSGPDWSTVPPELRAGDPWVFWRRVRKARLWVAALALTPRERAEMLVYLTRVYL